MTESQYQLVKISNDCFNIVMAAQPDTVVACITRNRNARAGRRGWRMVHRSGDNLGRRCWAIPENALVSSQLMNGREARLQVLQATLAHKRANP